MKRILIFGCLGILFLVGLISTTIFAVLYLNAQNESRVLNAELAACVASNSTSTTVNSVTTTCSETTPASEYTFKDVGQAIEITFPTTWTGVLTTDISTDFAYEPIYGRVVSKYDYNLTKSGTTLKFSKILGAVDGFPFGLKSSESDWVEITGTNLVRYSDKSANNWSYVQKIDCSTLPGPLFTAAEVATFDVCVGSFFPGFGTLGASSVNIKTSNATLLSEADLIVKSALN